MRCCFSHTGFDDFGRGFILILLEILYKQTTELCDFLLEVGLTMP